MQRCQKIRQPNNLYFTKNINNKKAEKFPAFYQCIEEELVLDKGLRTGKEVS